MTTDNEEEWRPVVGFPGYDVSNLGRVRSWRSNGRHPGLNTAPKLIKSCPAKGGYPLVDMRRGGRHFGRLVHRLVLEAFVGPCPTGMEGCHNDGDSSNAQLDNLRWDTPAANTLDKIEHGTFLQGSRVPSSILVEATVLEVDELLRRGDRQIDIAAKLGVSKGCIGSISSGRSWAWLTGRGPYLPVHLRPAA